MEEHEKDLIKQAKAKRIAIFNSIKTEITHDEEQQIKELLREYTAQDKLDGFETRFAHAMAALKAALRIYRRRVYYSAPNKWLGRKDYVKQYAREVGTLAKKFGGLAKALEELTYFQLAALDNRHKELYMVDARTGLVSVEYHQAYPKNTSLVNGLRRMEEHLKSHSMLDINSPYTKSMSQDLLRHQLREIYSVATGEEAPKQTTDPDTNTVGGRFVSFVELIYLIAGITEIAAYQIKKSPYKPSRILNKSPK